MALTADQLAQIRRMVSDTDNQFWSDDLLLASAEAFALDDGTYDLRGMAASLWEERAASWSSLVRTSESGSSRDLQQKFDHAIVMARRFQESGSGTPTDPDAVYPRSTRIVRPTREG